MKYLSLILSLSLLMAACSPAPQPIEYGTDACAHCMMTIVDKPFAAELVTTKAKVFKFDAIECMVQYMAAHTDTEFALHLVQDYKAPDEWHDAEQCFYLISQNLPSPMGAYLSAYKDEVSANRMQAEKGGEVLDWESLKKKM